MASALRGRLANIGRLFVKEVRSVRADPVLAVFIVYAFTFAIYAVATGASTEMKNAAIAVVDEDGSALSRRLADALMPPLFKPPVTLDPAEVDAAMDSGTYAFVVVLPPRLEADVLAGRPAEILVDVDATAMTLAGNGAGYLQSILLTEVARFLTRAEPQSVAAAEVVVRARFNPNLDSADFTAVMQVINNITMLSVILTGAALIREREHGTIEHLLVMPVTPAEIMLSKILANGFIIVAASFLALVGVVEWLLGVPVAGSLWFFLLGVCVYEFSVAALGILLATVASSMAQFGLLALPVLIVMNLLSGASTPMESMPAWLQWLMQLSPSTHFVAFSQGVLYRGAGFAVLWPQLAALSLIGAVIFALALRRFRRVVFGA